MNLSFKEYRFFVVNEDVITGSQYKDGDKVLPNSYIPPEILETAKEYAKLYQPHEIFTMDLTTTPEGTKIVEYNCWNGSGLYHCDKLKVFNAVENFMQKKNIKKNKLLN